MSALAIIKILAALDTEAFDRLDHQMWEGAEADARKAIAVDADADALAALLGWDDVEGSEDIMVIFSGDRIEFHACAAGGDPLMAGLNLAIETF